MIEYLEKLEFDLTKFYEDQGCTVIRTRARDKPLLAPMVHANCVGFVKFWLCIRSWALTPWQLYRHLERANGRRSDR